MINYIIKLFSFVFGYSLLTFIKRIKNKLVTESLIREFKSCGYNFNICWPCIIINAKLISIGNNVQINRNIRLQAISEYEGIAFTPIVKIGDEVVINPNCQIVAINEIIIEENVLIASNVFISDHLHGNTKGDDLLLPPAKRKLFSKGAVHICKNVWIGQNVVILGNVKVGENAIIGANSVVTRDIPPFSIYGGIPAKNLRK